MGICNNLITFAQNMKEMERERTVIHLEIDGEHHYYGSVANMYEFYTGEELGITYSSLRNYGLSIEHPYKNKKCIIRKGVLLSKSGGRGKRKEQKQEVINTLRHQ